MVLFVVLTTVLVSLLLIHGREVTGRAACKVPGSMYVSTAEERYHSKQSRHPDILHCLWDLASFKIDFENDIDCSSAYVGPHIVGDEDKFYLVARPRRHESRNAHECVVKFSSSRQVRLFTKHFVITDPGVTLEIYNQTRVLKDPQKILTCQSADNKVYAYGAEMTLRLVKVSPVSSGYNFAMQITTMRSPLKEYTQRLRWVTVKGHRRLVMADNKEGEKNRGIRHWRRCKPYNRSSNRQDGGARKQVK